MPQHSSAFSRWLDFFRWTSALVVLVCHAGGIITVPYTGLPASQKTLMHAAYSAVAGSAGLAVMLFFVLSGYLVGGSFYFSVRGNRENILNYTLKRIVRLWIVLLPMLLLSTVLLYADQFIDAGAVRPQLAVIADQTNLGYFLCNAAFMQNALCSHFGGNFSLWSLFHEFWYYVLFPFVCLGFFSSRAVSQRVACLAAAAAILGILSYLQFVHPPIAPYFLIWLSGMAAAALPRPLVSGNLPLATVIFVVVFAVARLGNGRVVAGLQISEWWTDLATALAFAHLLICLRVSSRLRPPPGGAVHPFMAGFSYSLYCIHCPILVFFATVMERTSGLGFRMVPTRPVQWLVVLTSLVFSIACAYLFSLGTERHTDALRLRIASFLSTGGVPQAGRESP